MEIKFSGHFIVICLGKVISQLTSHHIYIAIPPCKSYCVHENQNLQ